MRRHMSRRPAAPSGFTLIEVLVAMVIMSLLAVMAWQGMDGIVRARDSSQTRLDQALRLNTVMAQWDQDLASLQDASPNQPYLKFDGNTLRLIRRTEQGLQLVAWSVRPAQQPGQQQLLRWASLPMTGLKDMQDAWLRSQQFVGTEPGQLRTLTGIARWQIYFFRDNSWTNAQSSGNVAPLGDTDANGAVALEVPPKGVRLVLTFAQDSGLSGALTRDVALGPRWQP